MFCILQVYIRYKVKIGESADVIEAMAGVGAQSQVVRWPLAAGELFACSPAFLWDYKKLDLAYNLFSFMLGWVW